MQFTDSLAVCLLPKFRYTDGVFSEFTLELLTAAERLTFS
jgi:hypothetical protein